MRSAHEVAILVHRGDRFLMTRWSRDGAWNVPAGQVEPGEPDREAAARELMEEVALDAPLLDLGVPQSYAIAPGDRARYAQAVRRVTLTSFAAAAPPRWEPLLNEEHDEYRWCSRDEALALLHFDEAKIALRALVRTLGART